MEHQNGKNWKRVKIERSDWTLMGNNLWPNMEMYFLKNYFFSNRQPIRSLQQMFPLLLSLLDSGSTYLMLVLMTSLGQSVRLFVNALQCLKRKVFRKCQKI